MDAFTVPILYEVAETEAYRSKLALSYLWNYKGFYTCCKYVNEYVIY